MDIDKFFTKVEKVLDKVEQTLDGKDANSVWSTATRTERPANSKVQPQKFSRVDLEFLFDAAAAHPDRLVRQHTAKLRAKYLGNA